MSEKSEDKNWSIKWMQKAEILNCVFNRMKELQDGAEPRSEEDTLMWILDRTKNHMLGFTLDEISSMSGGEKCINAGFCPFFNKVISEDTQIE